MLRLQLLLLLQLQLILTPALSQTAAKQPECTHPECKQLSALISMKMNSSADPCEDFYEFACGNYRHTVHYDVMKSLELGKAFGSNQPMLLRTSLDEVRTKVERKLFELLTVDKEIPSRDAEVSDLFSMAREMLSSCHSWTMARKQDETYEDFFNDTLNHLLGDIQPDAEDTAEQLLAQIISTGTDSLISFHLSPVFAEEMLQNEENAENVTRAVINTADISSMSSFDYAPYVKLFGQSKQVQSLLSLVGHEKQLNETRDRLEKSIISEFGSGTCNEVVEKINKQEGRVSVQQLQELSECKQPNAAFSWPKFFARLLKCSVSDSVKLKTHSLTKLVALANFIKRQPAWVSSCHACSKKLSPEMTFFVVDWLFSFLEFLPSKMKQRWEQEGYRRNLKLLLLGLNLNDGLEAADCLALTKTLFEPIVQRMYRSAYHPQSFHAVRKLVSLLKRASIRSVQQQSWISNSSKEAIVEKLHSVRKSIGFQQLQDSDLLKFYNTSLAEYRQAAAEVPVGISISFGQMLAIGLCASARQNFDLIAGHSEVSIFMLLNAFEVNAYNYMEKNQIIFPIAILSPPLYHTSYPAYANLGSIGYIIGHEIGHSFDNTGHTLMKDGASGHFWDNSTEEGFLERMECVRSRFAELELLPGVMSPANDTIGNDIADIIGISAAVSAWKMLKEQQQQHQRLPGEAGKFSPEQIIFIRAAQSWCMKSEPDAIKELFGKMPSHTADHLRVRGLAEHSEEFVKAFNCRPKQAMNPEAKCKFW